MARRSRHRDQRWAFDPPSFRQVSKLKLTSVFFGTQDFFASTSHQEMAPDEYSTCALPIFCFPCFAFHCNCRCCCVCVGARSGEAARSSADRKQPVDPAQREPGSGAARAPEARGPLCGGRKRFYAQAHIPGAENIGPCGPAGRAWKSCARGRRHWPKTARRVVIYCGCCPWDHWAPTFVRRVCGVEEGRGSPTSVRSLYLGNSFWRKLERQRIGLVATGE